MFLYILYKPGFRLSKYGTARRHTELTGKDGSIFYVILKYYTLKAALLRDCTEKKYELKIVRRSGLVAAVLFVISYYCYPVSYTDVGLVAYS